MKRASRTSEQIRDFRDAGLRGLFERAFKKRRSEFRSGIAKIADRVRGVSEERFMFGLLYEASSEDTRRFGKQLKKAIMSFACSGE